jgi:REP element-mobilizing transposase RayT
MRGGGFRPSSRRHVVFIPKCRRRALYGQLRRHLGEVFPKLAVRKEGRIEQGHLMPDYKWLAHIEESPLF